LECLVFAVKGDRATIQ